MQLSLQRCVILLNKAFAHFYNNAELFKHFVLITHDQGEKLRYENEVNVMCGDYLYFRSIVKAGEKNSTAH